MPAEIVIKLYQAHLEILQVRLESWLDEQGFDGVVIDSGVAEYYYQDDIQMPYRASPHFRHWLPLEDAAGSVLVVRPNRKPLLVVQQDSGFWHQASDYQDAFWRQYIELDITESVELSPLTKNANLVYLGPNTERAGNWNLAAINPPSLIAYLDWYRAYKTPYEQACMKQAGEIAQQGHDAVAAGFEQGLSEWQLHLTYLQTTAQSEQQLPYPNIIAVNEHAAVLHYQQRDRAVPSAVNSLLIDAGANYLGFGADISRTYAAEPGVFADLIALVEEKQQQIIDSLRVGMDYLDVHLRANLLMAEVLNQSGIVDVPADEQLATGLVQHFFPHGVGHLLGLQTHDVGGHQQDVFGATRKPPQQHPFLRLTRTIETNMVFTIEPGIYFIPSLLKQLQQHNLAQKVDWLLVDSLRSYGGIRIEDNVLMTDEGTVQFSR